MYNIILENNEIIFLHSPERSKNKNEDCNNRKTNLDTQFEFTFL